MRKHTISTARLLMPVAAMTILVGLAACGSDAPPPTVTKTETTRTTTTPGYVTQAPMTTGTTTTQTTVTPVQ
jgi:hypothetical protein